MVDSTKCNFILSSKIFSFLSPIFFTSFLLFIHRSCITHGNIVLKVVNKCLENVKTTEQQLKLSVPPV